MRNNAVEKINNVVLVDPNLVNVNTNQINPIPEYETMHIQADLIAKRKGRTVLNSGGNSTTEETITVNLMGFNQNSKNPNFENFTTNYYDGSTGNETQYESFGITSIKTSINSSFIPEVEIEFVDIRGLSFFNQNSEKETSPYRILFDFPPPLFELTIKGYYGKALKYKLHLVSYTSDFNSSNGNFVINAKFVAITFAPLADVLFRYIVNFPLIDSGSEYSPEQTTFPKNTNELALKTRNLITATEKYKSESFDKINYDNIVEAGNAYTEAMTFIAGSRNSSKLENISEPAIFFIKNKNESPDLSEVSNANTNTLTKIENIYDDNDLIIRKQVVGVLVNMDERIDV